MAFRRESNYCLILIFPGSDVEIESASVDCSHDQDEIENGIPVVSVSSRGKRMGNYCTNSGIYTVDYEIKGNRRKMLGKTIKVENVP